MAYLEGSFGALVMAAAGIGAILSASFGQFKAALSLMVVAVGAFILRSLISTFFNDVGIRQ
jgi:predicted dinucleotide-utilizing enzyme